MTYRLTIAYRGGAYAGWQRQTNAVAVQQRVEEALARIVGSAVTVHAAGRTDAGVHAAGQVAHFEHPSAVADRALVHGVNRFLPEDVRVLAAERVADGFHARKSAAGKEYCYRLERQPVLSPLDAPFAVRVEPQLDVATMRRASAHLVGRHDFTAFATSGGAHTDPHREIFSTDWCESGTALRFHLTGDGFLRGMVRALVGTLLEVGRGRRTEEAFAGLLEGAPRQAAGPNAPAHGLTLVRVFYPERWASPGSERPVGGPFGDRR